MPIIQIKPTEFSDLITRYTPGFDTQEMRGGVVHRVNVVEGGDYELHQLRL
jgi:hypothetical protein